MLRRKKKETDLRVALNVITWMTARLPAETKRGDDWEDVDAAVRTLFVRLSEQSDA